MTNKPGVIIIEGHVQGLANTRALGEAGIPVVVVDKDNCIARYSKYCKGFYKCPDYKSDEFARFLCELAINQSLKNWLLLPSNDHAVHTIARHREQLSSYYKIITPDIEIINNIYNKHNLLNIAKRINIPIPNTIYPATESELNEIDLKFPVMVKGKEGLTFYKSTGRKAFIAANKQQLFAIYKQIQNNIAITNTFIQEIIPSNGSNKTISFTAFCIKGEIKAHWTGVKLREHPANFGTATYTKSITNETVFKLASKLLQELRYSGVCEVEFLRDYRTNQYKLIEINARTWLWVGLAIACGINYPVIVYKYLNGLKQEFPTSYKIGVEWMNHITDIYQSIKDILQGDLTLKEYLKSLRKKKEFAIYRYKDIKPLIMFFLLLPYLVLKRG